MEGSQTITRTCNLKEALRVAIMCHITRHNNLIHTTQAMISMSSLGQQNWKKHSDFTMLSCASQKFRNMMSSARINTYIVPSTVLLKNGSRQELLVNV